MRVNCHFVILSYQLQFHKLLTCHLFSNGFGLRLNPERISGDFNEEVQVRNIVILLQNMYCYELHAQPVFL